MLMVKAGEPVDELIGQLVPYLSPGDVIIDGGNSDFKDTARRVKMLEEKGLYFVGSGISGGEEGALNGPSIMPGGSETAWPLVKDILQTAANDVYLIEGPEGKEYLFPSIKECILNVDLEAGTVTVHIMDGLLDL